MQRKIILATGALIAMLTPFTDTVYLPVLEGLRTDLNTSEFLVSLTVSIYLASVGIGQLVWGPLSDQLGRLPVLIACLIAFEGITIAIIFAKDITAVIIERTFQGLIVGSTILSVQGIIADIFPPELRGGAMGAFLGPMLIGPIVAPLIGGGVGQVFGWR